MNVLICKKTKKKFKDFENKSGIITKHLESLNINIPSSYIRRKYFIKNEIYWHIQFFDIEKQIEEEKFKCKYCNWETRDVNNKSGCYTTHLKKVHKKNINDYLNDFPKESVKFITFLNSKIKQKDLSKKNNHIKCKICGEKLRYITNTHLKKHKTTPEKYKEKYGINDFVSKNFKNKSTKILKNASKNIKKSFVSIPELELKDFINKNLNIETINNNRSIFNGNEIDLIIPNKKICFEFNGNLYHSENYGKKSRLYHLNKSIICKEKDYKLIHITEDEWYLKNKIVKEKIKSILNVDDKKSIYARKCKIKEIDSKEKNDFLNKNHIQGEDRSNIYLGAFFEDKLISVITLSNNKIMTSRIDDKNNYEIKRFASDINFKVVGIFSKFISFINKNYKIENLFTFLDIRWNFNEKNNVYAKNGFKLTSQLKPDYTYYNSKISKYKRYHKFSFGKSSLKKKFPKIYDNSKTEWEMMQELGYDRIWDCGKFKFEIKLK